MYKTIISIVLIISLMGCVLALDESEFGMQQEEAMAEKQFNNGIDQPWASGNPPSSSSLTRCFPNTFL
jgi:hypothetical protein